MPWLLSRLRDGAVFCLHRTIYTFGALWIKSAEAGSGQLCICTCNPCLESFKAEDARILGDIKGMRQAYAQLYTLNAELMGEYTKRANNHEELLAALKEVNHMIQKAAKLRVGAPKARIVAACRQAIKANNIHSLFAIIATGHPT